MLRRLVLPVILAGALGAAACGSKSTSTPTTPTSSSTVSIVSGARTLTTTAYSPNPVTISKGMTVMWVNNDTIAHTATSDAGSAASWNSGTMAAGASFSYTFSASGTFTYHCTLHPGMVGTVTVQ